MEGGMLSYSSLNRIINRRKQRAKRREDWPEVQFLNTLSYNLKHGMSVGLVAIIMRNPRYYVTDRIPECYGWHHE
jgi:hypothetical protein